MSSEPTTLITVPALDFRSLLTAQRLQSMWRMMSGFRLKYLSANLSLGFAAIFKTSTFMLVRYFTDNVLGKPEQNNLLPIFGVGFILLAAFEGSCTFLGGRLAAKTAEGITFRLRNYLFNHLQRLSFSYHSKAKTGELISRVTSDVDTLRRFFAEQAIGLGRILLLFLVNFIALLNLNVKMALVSIIAIPFVLATSIYFFGKVTKAYKAYQEQEAVLTTTLQENLTGVRVVKAFARQGYEIEKFENENWQKFGLGKKLMTMHSLFWPLSDILCGAQLLGGYIFAALMAINGEITIGTYLAYSGLVIWLIFPMRNMGRLIVQTSMGMVSLGRVLDIVKEEREPLDDGDYQPTDGLRGELIFEKVGFFYEDDDEQILEDISFRCESGQSIALLGSTGSGKTSLVNLLPRFHDYSSGHIYLDGVDLKRYTRRYVRSQIGIVEQEPFLFSRSLRENITYGVGRDVSQAEVETAARTAAIHDVILSFPDQYDTLVGEKGVTLSGGQKQRIAIARTLLKNPRILILDDSTSSVDFETENEIRQALEVLMKDRTTFIIAHRIQSVMDADLILVMDNGRIIQQGTHDELVVQDGLYRRIFDLQMRIESELEEELSNADPASRLIAETPLPGN